MSPEYSVLCICSSFHTSPQTFNKTRYIISSWGEWKKNGSSGSQTCSHDLTHFCLFQSNERRMKTLDNHQCLQYLSSKRLKAHIAYNWIWFALPASVREIKGKHKNPHDSFSSRWQARPNKSWKEYLWRKPSRLLARSLLEMTVLGNNEHMIKT